MRHDSEKFRFRPVCGGESCSPLLELLLKLHVERASLLFGATARRDVAKNPADTDEISVAVVHGRCAAGDVCAFGTARSQLERPLPSIARRLFSRNNPVESKSEAAA